MLIYLVLAGQNGAPVSPELIARFNVDEPPEAPFHPDARIVWRNHDASVVFFGWQAFTEVAGKGSHWMVDERGLTAFSGFCWPRSSGWDHRTGEGWAARLRDYLGDTPAFPEIREELFGQFTVLSLPANGAGWIVPDWVGFHQFFVADVHGATAFSNRTELCARAAAVARAAPKRSLTGAGWLIAEGWMLDEETGYWEVERPRAGSYAMLEPASSARIVQPEHSPFYPALDEPPAGYDELLAEIDRDLSATLHAIAKLPIDDRILALSGGKDSRTLLALILREGLQDRFRFATHGSPERADAIVAGELARRYGLDWSLADASGREPQDELDIIRVHTWLQEGLTSAWGTFTRPVFAPTAALSGVGGEGMRWEVGAASGAGATSAAELLDLIHRTAPLDRLGVLNLDARAYYQQVLDDRVRDLFDQGIPLISIPTIWIQEPWLHARNGPVITSSPRLEINPFLLPSVLRSNHRLPVDLRPDYRFHLDLQRRCSIELSKLPFADGFWPEQAYAQSPDADEYRRIEPVRSSSAEGRTWRQKRYADYRCLFEPMLLDSDNPIFELVDAERLAERVATGDAHPGRTRLIWGVLTAAIWMAGLEQPVSFERSAQTVKRFGI